MIEEEGVLTRQMRFKERRELIFGKIHYNYCYDHLAIIIIVTVMHTPEQNRWYAIQS